MKVVTTETLSNTASTATRALFTPASTSCSLSGMPSLAYAPAYCWDGRLVLSGSGGGVASGLMLGRSWTPDRGHRLPASYCGITGHKPATLVPKSGCFPLGFTFDHVGPAALGVGLLMPWC